MRPQPYLGESDFRNFREKDHYYVDKSLLLHAGYLKPTGGRTDESDRMQYVLTAPNREVGVFYRDVVPLWLKQSFGDERLPRIGLRPL